MLKKHKNIVIGITALILIFFGYWYFVLSKKDSSKTDSALVETNGIENGTQTSGANSYDKEFVANLQTVRYIDLNTEIFSKPAYVALSFPQIPFAVDYNIPVGRRNPFLPLGLDSSPTGVVQVQPVEEVVSAPSTTTAPVPAPVKR